MENEQKTFISIEIMSVLTVSIGIFGYWYWRDTNPWYRIFFAELFGAGILTALLPLAIFLEGKIIRNRFERIISRINSQKIRKLKILDIISPRRNTIRFTFVRISDNDAKKRIIEYLKIQIKKKVYTTDIFRISKALKIPAVQVNRVINKNKIKNKRFK